MIIVKLQGGLGNQMFQYALGRNLSLRHNTELKLDLTFLLDRTPKENFVYRAYEMGEFNIQAAIATESELKKYRWKDSNNRVYRKLNYFVRYPFHRYVKERHFHFDEQVLQAPRNVYLSGYWQSHKYFQDIENVISSDFAFNDRLILKNRSLAEQAASSNYICLNVRRGDFVTNPSFSSIHGVCENAYFYDALFFMKERLQNPEILVFSDDIEWCRKNLRFDCPAVFMDFDGSSHGYLYLMSLCKHFIIPNSTFGWWAAWLCTYAHKIVIAPKKWFNDPNIDTSDVTPSSWLRM
jgi:hypothetical protein